MKKNDIAQAQAQARKEREEILTEAAHRRANMGITHHGQPLDPHAILAMAMDMTDDLQRLAVPGDGTMSEDERRAAIDDADYQLAYVLFEIYLNGDDEARAMACLAASDYLYEIKYPTSGGNKGGNK